MPSSVAGTPYPCGRSGRLRSGSRVDWMCVILRRLRGFGNLRGGQRAGHGTGARPDSTPAVVFSNQDTGRGRTAFEVVRLAGTSGSLVMGVAVRLKLRCT